MKKKESKKLKLKKINIVKLDKMQSLRVKGGETGGCTSEPSENDNC